MITQSITAWQNHISLKVQPSTVKAYRWEIDQLQAAYPNQDLLTLTMEDLCAYLAKRKAGGLGLACIYRTTNALRSFFGHLRPADNPAASLPLQRPIQREQRTLTREEATRLIYSLDTSSLRGRRDLAMCALMLDSGLRAAELCRLELKAIDLEARLLHVIVKGGQEEFGVFSAETANFISAYLAARGNLKRCPKVFVSLEHHKRGDALTPDGLRTIFKRIGQEVGIEGLSPHVLRRSYATITSLLGAPARAAQEGGRWKRLEEYERYTRAIKLDAVRPYLPVSGIMRAQ